MGSDFERQPGRAVDIRLFWLWVVLILLLGAGLRLASLDNLPMFLDEGIHIVRARAVLEGDLFVGLEVNKTLQPVLIALFQPTGPESLWVARALSALAGVLTTAGCVALGSLLGGRRVGLLAGLLYAVVPFAIFHERQALADPLLAMLTLLATLLAVRVARRPRPWLALPMGLALAGAYLVKTPALLYLAVPFAAVALLTRPADRLKALGISLLGIALAAALVAWTYRQAALSGVTPAALYQVSLDSINPLASTGTAGLRLGRDLADYLDILLRYVGPLALLLAALAGAWAIRGERWREVLFLAIPAFGFALVQVAVERPTGFLAARYLLPSIPPLVVLSALGLALTVERLSARRPSAAQAGGWATLALTLGLMLLFDAVLIVSPARAPLPRSDVIQYVTGDPSGYGRADAAADLLSIWREGGGAPVDLLVSGSWEQMEAYLGPRVGDYQRLRLDSANQRRRLARWLAAGDRVFVFEGGPQAPVGAQPHGARLELVGSYQSGSGTLRLFEVIGAEGALADEVYARLAPEPGLMAEDYAALSASLEAGAAGSLVLVYPANHAAALAGVDDRDVIPLTLPRWPPDTAQVEAALDGLPLESPAQPLEVVLADEAHADPARVVSLALLDRFYYLDGSWFGLLHRLALVSGPDDSAYTAVGAAFEGPINLQSVAVVDGEAPPGGLIRLALAWESPVEILDSFHVFVHLVDEEGNLWAQHDGVPAAGLLPATGWTPGAVTVDRRAISLPLDLPAGRYDLRVGLYNPASGLRLAVLSGEEVGPDYVVVGHVDVHE
jgi:hypothetical protein